MLPFYAGRVGRGALDVSGATYSGPGDVFSSAFAWYSPARAYSAAFAAGGTAIMGLVDQAGSNPITINILSTGFADVASINAWVTANGVTTIKLTQLYDQSGHSRHLIQGTLASMPAVILSSTPTGTLPAVDFAGTSTLLATSATVTQAQPLTMSTVLNRTLGTAAGGAFGGDFNTFIGAGSGANLAQVSGGTALTSTAADAAWYSLQGLLNGNGTSSAVNVNGSDTLGAAGVAGLSGNALRLGRAGGSEFQGRIAEAGMWIVSSTATDRNNISANQHNAGNGYNF